ncbi:MAG TPA: hypothetical protein VHV32_10590, partial [Candidatus Angelobacter sp.]|nr:hypothetical protein [Candidatus Angelobacter sp.]
WAPTITAVLPRFTGNTHSSPVLFSQTENNPGKSETGKFLLPIDFNREFAHSAEGGSMSKIASFASAISAGTIQKYRGL